MSSISPPPHATRTALVAAVLLALAACTPPPPIVLHPPGPARYPAARTREPARTPRCEQPARRAPLTEAQKARLFDDFDGWKGERRPPGTAADATPPPAPGQNRATPPGCRVPRP